MSYRFSGGLSPREHLSGKPPTALLTRIDAADRLFSVSFNTHNKRTGVCRFVRGIPVGIGRRVAELWGFCGARRSPRLGRPTRHGYASPADFRILTLDDHFPVTQCHQGDLPACSNSAPADYGRLTTMPARG